MKINCSIAMLAASAALVLSQPAAMARTHMPIHQAPIHQVLGHQAPAHQAPAHQAASPVASDQQPGATWIGETGKASYYAARYNGRITSSGRRFNQNELTAAHAWLPFGTKIRVFCAATGRSVIVTVTDRMYSDRRILDLSHTAAAKLGMIRRGVVKVSLTPV